MDEKSKPYVTISFRQPTLSRVVVALALLVAVIAGAFSIQEIQRWKKQMLDTEARLHETEGKLTEATDRLHETEGTLTETTTRLHETEGTLTETTSRLHETQSILTDTEDRLEQTATSLHEIETKLQVSEISLAETTTRLRETETSFAESETRLQVTEAQLLDAETKLKAYLPISPLNEPIAFIAYSWGTTAITCIHMPVGYRARGDDNGVGRLLFYYAMEWDTVEAINESGQYTLVGGDEWSENWDAETWSDPQFYYAHIAVQDSNPYTWSKSKDWYSNNVSWQGRLTDYCRENLQP